MSRRFCGIAILFVISISVSGCCIDRFSGCGYYNGGSEEYAVDQCCGTSCGRHSPHDYCGRGSRLRRFITPFRRAAGWLTCGGGCGEVYWDEWLSDPPDCCDPCDDCGNWTGEGCCMPRLRKWLSNHRGQWRDRFWQDESCSSGGGCEGCGSSGSSCGCESNVGGCGCGGSEMHGMSLHRGEVLQSRPRRVGSTPNQPTHSVLRSTPSPKTSYATPRYTPPRMGQHQYSPGEVIYER